MEFLVNDKGLLLRLFDDVHEGVGIIITHINVELARNFVRDSTNAATTYNVKAAGEGFNKQTKKHTYTNFTRVSAINLTSHSFFSSLVNDWVFFQKK